MEDFGFENAVSIGHAVQLLDAYGSRAMIVAGGTNVMPNIHAGKVEGVTLISIRDAIGTGLNLNEMPITPEKILNAIKGKKM